MAKLKKKGSLGKTEEGELVLVNDEGQAFSAGEVVIFVWDMCDGEISEEDLLKNLCAELEIDVEALRPVLERLLKNLEKANLLEIID
ncbi:MAG: PqqD family protein [Candidatus Hadarchaeales archaeon]